MSLNLEPILSFSEITHNDKHKVGEKGLMVANLYKSKVPVPQGFIISSDAYYYFLDMARIREKILEILTSINIDDPSEVKEASTIIQKMIIKASVPPAIESQIVKSYSKLSGFISTNVAVRSSITIDNDTIDTNNISLATFLNIKGSKDLLLAVKASWASLFEPNIIEYISQNGINHIRAGIAVVIQKMVNAEVSGIALTMEALSKDQNKILIEASLGLGAVDNSISHEISQDQFEVEKSSMKIVSKRVAKQKTMLIRPSQKKNDTDEIKEVEVASKWQNSPKLSDKKIIELAQIAKLVEQTIGSPQQLEWIMSSNKLFILQTKDLLHEELNYNKLEKQLVQPLSELSIAQVEKEEKEPKATIEEKLSNEIIHHNVLAKGTVVFAGNVEGVAKIIVHDNDFMDFNDNDIMVIDKIVPDYILWMRKASAIITQQGGMTSHAAILSREFKIPCIIGVENALEKIPNNEYIKIDGDTGNISLKKINVPQSGKTEVKNEVNDRMPQVVPHIEEEPVQFKKQDEQAESVIEVQEDKRNEVPSAIAYKKSIHTATKIYANISNTQNSSALALKDIDGIGYINGTEILNNIIRNHPERFIEEEIIDKYVNEMASILNTFCTDFSPKPVIYKPSNLIPSELNFDSSRYEEPEVNPKIGYNGALKYIQNPSLFNLEVEVLKTVRNKYENKNISLMLPLIRDSKDLREIKKIITSNDLKRSSTFKIYLPIETPSSVLLIEELLDVGIDGVFIFAKSLSGHINAVDLDNPKYSTSFNVFNEAFMIGTEVVIKTAHKNKIPTGIVLEKGEFSERALKEIIQWGAIYLSVDPHYAEKTKEMVADIEKSLILSRKG